MSASSPHSELVATVRAGLGAGDRLVPGTMSEEEFQAIIALDRIEEQLEAARDALFKCYEASGSDTDGARKLSDMGRIDPPIEVLAVRAVGELRRDYDEAIAWDGAPNPASVLPIMNPTDAEIAAFHKAVSNQDTP